jgi:hypothetical protein
MQDPDSFTVLMRTRSVTQVCCLPAAHRLRSQSYRHSKPLALSRRVEGEPTPAPVKAPPPNSKRAKRRLPRPAPLYVTADAVRFSIYSVPPGGIIPSFPRFETGHRISPSSLDDSLAFGGDAVQRVI